VVRQRKVEEFYEHYGWKFCGSNSQDSIENENINPNSQEYIKNVRLRIKANLGQGEKLLDIGCGPLQYPEYVQYGDNFDLRVCCDLSKEAISIAKTKVAPESVMLVGNYLELDLSKHFGFDGIAIINCLYHMEKSDQIKLVSKAIGDLKTDGRMVVVYTNTLSPIYLALRFVIQVKHLVFRSKSKHGTSKPIVFMPQSRLFWKNFTHLSSYDVRAWRTFPPQFERLLFRGFIGRKIQKAIFELEKFKFWSWIATYHLITIIK
jgi:2-polyprenyl-3-methyl-5-hydroxy-6-metoxy-1,4-benzoquinol methylase